MRFAFLDVFEGVDFRLLFLAWERGIDVLKRILRATYEMCQDSLRVRNAVISGVRDTRAKTGQQNQGGAETRN